MTLRTKSFIDSAGGYRLVADRLGEKPRTVHNWTTWEKFPAAQYQALRALAQDVGVEAPADDLFPFKAYPPEVGASQ